MGDVVRSLDTGRSVNSVDQAPGPNDVAILKTSCVSYDSFDSTERKKVVSEETDLVRCPVEAGTIIVSRMNTPERVGACGYVPASYANLYLPDRLWKLSISKDCDAFLLYELLASEPYKAQIKGMASGTSGSMHNVPQGPFMDLILSLPRSIDEQCLISSCFSRLDNLITLHQRKRRKGLFTHPLAWEQRKLGELCTISKGHGYSKADIRDAGTPLILYGRLYTQYESRIEDVDTFAVEQEGSLLSKGNEVIVPASGETAEDIAIASSVRRSGIIFGGDLNVVTPVSKLDPDYTALAITYSKAHDDLAKRAQGKSVVHVHSNDIAEVEVSYPSESEQKRISTVVLHLDNLITLHQREPQFTDMGYMRVERALMTMSISLFSSS